MLILFHYKWCIWSKSKNIFDLLFRFLGFPGNSAGKESACNAGDPSSIPGSERSARERIGYPLLYSWASLVAQLVRNLSVVWETWVWYLSWEDPLEKGKSTHSSILAWRIPWTIQSMGSQRIGHGFCFHFFLIFIAIFYKLHVFILSTNVISPYLLLILTFKYLWCPA